MKKLKSSVALILTAFFLTVITVGTAAAQPGKHKYYYYPGSNVYYAPGPGLYYYNSGPSWTGVRVLPPNVSITTGAPRYVVYHNTPEVWIDNSVHVVKYKAHKNKPKKHKKHGKHH